METTEQPKTTPKTDRYTANPNQHVYDQAHQTDFVTEVLEIYFAEKVPKYKWEPKEDVYTVKSGGKVADVKKKYEGKNRRNIQADPDHENPLKKDDQIKVTWDEQVEDGFDYKKIKKTSAKKKIFLIARCTGEKGKLTINLNENKLTETEQIYDSPLKFLDGDTEQTKVEFTLDGSMTYAKEIALRPKSDEDLKKLAEQFDKRKDPVAYIYAKAEVSGTGDTVKYPDETQEFLNKDGDRLEVRFCDCGIKYRNDVECTRWSGHYGPVYWGEMPLDGFAKWDELVKNNTVTETEKTILIAMSENEGKMDAVQSYDSEILTAGAMQKTINPEGYGELPVQLWEFKSKFPDKYDCYLKSCGWEIEEEAVEKKNKQGEVISTTYKYKAKYNDLTGSALKDKIREGFDASQFKKKVKSEPVEPIIKLMKDVDFQTKQIEDFVKRLNSALAKTPTGYSGSISTFVSSNLGKATVLDHDVNRPGHVKDCFGEALNTFFGKHPKLSKSPADWGADAAGYETEILEIYGPLRGEGSYTMTDASGRYAKLKSKL
ncbi:hypothetical protein [Taibaiella koreensis]|uniref:hypothetical protein n=1 Tax=Taibaiella koreensis TaxID=1268548 RepID=UPI001969759D|nr:hypothetical protein [Taibaiella koreensis]